MKSLNKKSVVIVRANSIDRETRATKIIKSLNKSGYIVKFLGWDKGLKTPRSEKSEIEELYEDISFKFNAPWGIMSIFYIPLWWIYIIFKLLITNWDVVHAIQIISIPPALIVAKIKRKKVVYDILDTYEDSIVMPIFLRNIIMVIDKVFIRLSDYIILADEEQIEEFEGIPNSNVTVIYDSPYEIEFTKNNYKNKEFVLFFAGLLYSGKKLNLKNFFTAIKNVDNVKVIIAGHGNLVNQIKECSKNMPDKIEFIGEITHKEVLQRSFEADALFMIRDSLLPVNKYICGSKILESMMCSTPIIVSNGTSTAKKVNQEKCGLVVNPKDINEIKLAIEKLRDNLDMCAELGLNARKAYLNSYGWHIMEKRLLKIYAD